MTQPGSSVTMDEINEQLAAADADGKALDLSAVKLEGDNIPAELRGKTITELLREREVLAQSVQIANSARLAAEAAAKTVVAAPAPLPSPEPTPKRMTKEAWDELYQTNPMEAIAYMNEIAIQDAAQQFERRFGSLAAGASSSAEARAREQFKDEFELFETEIKQIAASVPDKSALATPEGWSYIVSFVRGKPENFEKLIERRNSRAAEQAAIAARQAQDGLAGASFSSSSVRAGSSPAPTGDKGGEGGTFGLDAEERRAADNMNISYKEYAHWKKIGG